MSDIKENTRKKNAGRKAARRKVRAKDLRCKDCVMFEYDGFPYCLVQDLYTEVGAEDEICEEFLFKGE